MGKFLIKPVKIPVIIINIIIIIIITFFCFKKLLRYRKGAEFPPFNIKNNQYVTVKFAYRYLNVFKRLKIKLKYIKCSVCLVINQYRY